VLFSVGVSSARADLTQRSVVPTFGGDLFHICILQFGPSFFVFLARYLSGGISPLQQSQRRLHFPVGSPAHWSSSSKVSLTRGLLSKFLPVYQGFQYFLSSTIR